MDERKPSLLTRLSRYLQRAEPTQNQAPSFFGQKPRAMTPDERTQHKPNPAPTLEKNPTQPHVGITTRLTSEWQQTGTVRPGDFSYEAKVYSQPSEHGIDGSEVSKLRLKDANGNEVASYDRGWDEQPQPGSPEAKAVQQIVAFYRENARDMPHVAEPESKQEQQDAPAPTLQQRRTEAMQRIRQEEAQERASDRERDEPDRER